MVTFSIEIEANSSQYYGLPGTAMPGAANPVEMRA
jgi:hypothetical protein